MDIFRIVHITDLHISNYPNEENLLVNENESTGARAEWFLRQVFARKSPFRPSSFDTDAAIKLRQQILDSADLFDAVVVTGDLSTTGLNGDLNLARNFIMDGKVPITWNSELQQYDAIAEQFPVILMPGNHDRYKIAFTPGGKEFESVFGNDWQAGQNFVVQHAGEKVRGVCLEKNGKSLYILCADFTLQSVVDASVKGVPSNSLSYIGQGCVTQKVLDNLVGETNKIKALSADNVVIWATHFPPQYPEIDERLELTDGKKLSEAAKSSGVFLLISGHTHEDRCYEANSIPVICTGTACAYGKNENLSFSVIEISINKTQPDWQVRQFGWNKKQCYFSEILPISQ